MQNLILDEPTSSLNSIETQQLFEWLRELKEQGIGIIFISHRLDELSLITDRISILRDGELVYTGATDKIHQVRSWIRSHAKIEKHRQKQHSNLIANPS